jgi:thymidylate kinase
VVWQFVIVLVAQLTIVGGGGKNGMQTKGIFLSIEGPSEVFAAAQLDSLQAHLQANGHQVAVFEFPYYDQPSSYFVRNYIEGRYGNGEELNPYTSALFFALDRYQLAVQIRQALDAGKVVLAHNYTGATMAEQGLRLKTEEEQRGFLIWLDNLEFLMLGLPRPDRTLLVGINGQPQSQMYERLNSLFPKDFRVIRSAQPEHIQNSVSKIIKSLQTPEAASTVADFYTPPSFNKATRGQYHKILQQILSKHQGMLRSLRQTNPHADTLLKAVLPLAAVVRPGYFEILHSAHQKLEPLANKHLNLFEAMPVQPVQLTNVWPRNEMDLLSDMLYGTAAVSYQALQTAIEAWPYERKLQLFDTYIGHRQAPTDIPGAALTRAQYQWDIVSSYSEFSEFATLPWGRAEPQPVTPRYGYEVPAEIEDAELTDTYLECFDLSLELHSYLQEAGHPVEAQYAALMGHKVRWQYNHNAQDAFRLFELASAAQTSPVYAQLARTMHERLAQVHPLLAETMVFVNKPARPTMSTTPKA